MKSIKTILDNWQNNQIDKTYDTDLCKLYKKYGSDKKGGGCNHNYPNFYKPVFDLIKEDTFNFFEVGLGTNNTDIPWNMGPFGKPGASLYAARDYFSNALIFGADFDKRILFEFDRIKTFFCDQKNESTIKSMWEEHSLKDKSFEIIIDDGCHEYEANYCFAVNSLHKLSKGGVFFVEDMCPIKAAQMEKQKEFFVNSFELNIFKILQMRADIY